VTDGEVDDGVRGIGAPVFYGKGGQLAAGLSVAGPIFRLTDQVLPEVVDAVVDAARRLTERLELTTA
jgi:DNA-binding IclR family transcriptional regulator